MSLDAPVVHIMTGGAQCAPPFLYTLVKTAADPDTVAEGPKMPHCSEAWDAIARYIYAGLQGGSIMKGWMKKENEMIACCSDGTRPVIFKIERMDEEE